MNYSTTRSILVNTYGAFGTIGRERDEIIFEGTDDSVITGDTKWKEYDSKRHLVTQNRRPPFVAPYHCGSTGKSGLPPCFARRYPVVSTFCLELLHNDPGTLSLLANNPFRRTTSLHPGATLSLSIAPIGETSG